MLLLSLIFGILLCVSGYIIFNLFRKVEKLESVVLSQNLFITYFGQAIGYADQRLNEIDEKGAFQSDDEVGWFFESIKTLQRELNDFNLSPQPNNMPKFENPPPPLQNEREPLFQTSNSLNDIHGN